MSNPSSKHGFNLSKSLLGVGLFSGLQKLAAAAESPSVQAALAVVVGPGGGVLAAFLKGLITILEKRAEHTVMGHFWPDDDVHASANGLNHDLERAATRALIRTLAALIEEWQQLPADQRGSEYVEQPLSDIARQCHQWLLNHEANPTALILADWVDQLDHRAIRVFADVEPDADLFAELTAGLPLREHFFRASTASGKWFAARFPSSFELHLWDELKRQPRAWTAFLGGLFKRSLELHKETQGQIQQLSAGQAQQTEELTRLSGLVDKLHAALAATRPEGALFSQELLKQSVDLALAELKQLDDSLLQRIRLTLAPDLIAVVQLVTEHATRETNRAMEAYSKQVRRIEAQIAQVSARVGDEAQLRDQLQDLKRQLADLRRRPWHPPRSPDQFFGRAEDIEKVASLLSKHLRLALTGAGGIGKTALAAQAIRHLAPSHMHPGLFPSGIYSHDYYQLAGHSQALDSILAQAGRQKTDDAQKEAVVQSLLDQPGVLLYLEGCEKAQNPRRLLNLAGRARVLLTSRDLNKVYDAHPHPVKPLDELSAARLLHYHAVGTALATDEAGQSNWRSLASVLGAHPLALRLAGAWLARRRQKPEELQRLFRKNGFNFWNTDLSEKENLDVLFRQTLKSCTRKHPQASEAWFALTIHAHAPVPLPALCGTLGCDADTAEVLLGALQDYSVAEPVACPGATNGSTERAWQLTHALLREWGRDQSLPVLAGATSSPQPSSPSDAGEAADGWISANRHTEILLAWRAWWVRDLERSFDYGAVLGGPSRYLALQPHWGSLLEGITQWKSEEQRELSTEQFFIAGIHLMMGSYSLAEPLNRRALEARERTLGLEHPDTLGSLNNLAILLRDKGDLAGAESLNRRALEARERTLGLEHPDTLGSLNNLAVLLKAKGDLDAALPLFERAVRGAQTKLLPNHPHRQQYERNLDELRRTLAKGGEE